MGTVPIQNDIPESWAPAMPGEDDPHTPGEPPTPLPIVRYNTPIEERGHAAEERPQPRHDRREHP